MRYMTLIEMLDALRIEARISQSAAHGLTLRDPHTYLLNRIQDDLVLNFDWPSLAVNEIIDIGQGQRYVAYPDGMTFESVRGLYSPDTGGDYRPLTFGIGPEQINCKDPTVVADRDFPLQRFANYVPATGSTNHNMLEVWPVPDRDTKLYFKGYRYPTKMANDADKSLIDGPSIVLHAAAEILAGQKAEDASLKLNKAQERIRTLKIRQRGSDNREYSMSRAASHARLLRPGIDYIP